MPVHRLPLVSVADGHQSGHLSKTGAGQKVAPPSSGYGGALIDKSHIENLKKSGEFCEFCDAVTAYRVQKFH